MEDVIELASRQFPEGNSNTSMKVESIARFVCHRKYVQHNHRNEMFSACFRPVAKYFSIRHTKCFTDSKPESSVEWNLHRIPKRIISS